MKSYSRMLLGLGLASLAYIFCLGILVGFAQISWPYALILFVALLGIVGSVLLLLRRMFEDLRREKKLLHQRDKERAASFKDAEARFHSALAAAHAGIYRLDLKPGTAFRNASLNKIFGLEEKEGIYPITDFMERIHDEDKARVGQSIQLMLRDKSSFSERYRVYGADGSIIWIKDRGRVLCDENGEVEFVTGTMVDITDLVAAEESLQRSQEQFRLLIASIKDYGIFHMDLTGTIVSWNIGAERITGYSEVDAIGRPLDLIFSSSILDRDGSADELRIAAEKGMWQGESWHTRKNGDAFLAQEVVYPLQRAGAIYGYAKVIGDITLRKQAEDQLKHNEARFRQLLEAIPQMVWSARGDFRFDYANRRWLDYTGMSQAEIAKDGWTRLFDPEDTEHTMQLWRTASEQKSPFSHEVRIRRGDGSYRWHLCRALPILDMNGNISEWFGTHTDIEEQKQLQSELMSAKQEAEEASQLKSAFLATVSHEIRTPLSAIIGFSLLLTEEKWQEEKMREFAQIALRNGYALARIIDDILDLSKVEAGKLEISKMEVSISELLAEVLESLSVKAQEKSIGLLLNIDENVPRTLATDPVRLRQILVNIIGNAIKFTDIGEVSLHVKKEEGDPEQLAIFVKDTGCGISSQNAAYLFQAFVQADTSTSRRYGGTGLGLALSRKLSQLLGGNVLLMDSQYGRGSTFKIHFPINALPVDASVQRLHVATPNKVEGATREAPLTGRLQGLRILVAEDAVDTQLLIRQVLKKQGAEIDFADNGKQAIEYALNKDYDIILMDIQMPIVDGYQATRRLRAKDYRKPIIGLSAHAMREEREKIIASGCNEHLAKPFDPKRLIALIESLVYNAPASGLNQKAKAQDQQL